MRCRSAALKTGAGLGAGAGGVGVGVTSTTTGGLGAGGFGATGFGGGGGRFGATATTGSTPGCTDSPLAGSEGISPGFLTGAGSFAYTGGGTNTLGDFLPPKRHPWVDKLPASTSAAHAAWNGRVGAKSGMRHRGGKFEPERGPRATLTGESDSTIMQLRGPVRHR